MSEPLVFTASYESLARALGAKHDAAGASFDITFR